MNVQWVSEHWKQIYLYFFMYLKEAHESGQHETHEKKIKNLSLIKNSCRVLLRSWMNDRKKISPKQKCVF